MGNNLTVVFTATKRDLAAYNEPMLTFEKI
jgi:hypothetical protein